MSGCMGLAEGAVVLLRSLSLNRLLTPEMIQGLVASCCKSTIHASVWYFREAVIVSPIGYESLEIGSSSTDKPGAPSRQR